jgi:hypothetical protein
MFNGPVGIGVLPIGAFLRMASRRSGFLRPFL